MTRQVHDEIALGVHLVMAIVIAVYVIGGRDDVYEQTRLGLILGVELFSFVFHAWVVAGWRHKSTHKYMHKFWKTTGAEYDHWNWFKWYEYAVTATMGTIAVGIKSAHRVPSDSIALLCTVLAIGGVAQQITGYYIDKPDKLPSDTKAANLTNDQKRGLLWLSAVGWQIAEFFIVGSDWGLRVSAQSSLFIVYVVMWSSFGVIAALRSMHMANFYVASAFDVNVSETLYSAFGWMAKLAVSATTLTDIVCTSNRQTFAVGIAFAVVLPVLVMIFTIGAHRSKPGSIPYGRPGAPLMVPSSPTAGAL
jgi:hypothetical protein